MGPRARARTRVKPIYFEAFFTRVRARARTHLESVIK